LAVLAGGLSRIYPPEHKGLAEEVARAGALLSEAPMLDEAQRCVWDALAEGPRHVDQLVQQLGMSVAPLAGMLLVLEMKKIVRRLPGNRYERC
jgi:DNA processing protein